MNNTGKVAKFEKFILPAVLFIGLGLIIFGYNIGNQTYGIRQGFVMNCGSAFNPPTTLSNSTYGAIYNAGTEILCKNAPIKRNQILAYGSIIVGALAALGMFGYRVVQNKRMKKRNNTSGGNLS